MRPDSDSEARPAQCHDQPASRARRRRLEVQLEDFQFFFALRGATTARRDDACPEVPGALERRRAEG